MGKINVLSFAVANLIAAGEVVDRPASVIKELMENAIDAGSTRITVEIQNGGVTFMRVSDNGCGMAAEDLPIAVRRHATSKIKEAEDLDGILTLGFRGEALAAIASVSHLRIFSKPHGAEMGAVLEAYGGENVTLTEQGCSDGTTVIVEDLFANVPARRKFLKKDVTEAMAVAANVEKVALSRPDIAFRLIVDGNVRLETAGDNDLRHTVYAVFGKDFASRLIEIEAREEGGVAVSGFIGRPDNVKSNRNFQNYFINGRYVKSKTACAAVEQAYCSYMPPEKFPCCVLNIQIQPAAVDVNVHPAKLEVKFSNEKPVFEAIYYAVRNALEQDKQRPDIKLSQGHVSAEEARRLFAAQQQPQRPRVSDAMFPIRDGRAESVQKQQMKMDMPTRPAEHQTSPRQGTVLPHGVREETQMSAPASVKPFRAQLSEESSAVPAVIPQSNQIQREPATSRNVTSPERVLSDYIRHYEEGKIVRLEGEDPAEQPASAPQPAQTNASEVSSLREKGQTVPATEEISAGETPVPAEPLHYRVIGEVWNAYILVEQEDKLLLIDQHAAHERIIFEQLKAAMRAQDPMSQMLMLPIEFEFSMADALILEEYRAEIEAIGFLYEVADRRVSVYGIPIGVESGAVEDMFSTIADRIRTDTGSAQLTRDMMFEKALYQASCKAAIKAGRVYAAEHITWVCDQLMRIPDITVCPHGRPVAMTLSRSNLDRQFKRT